MIALSRTDREGELARLLERMDAIGQQAGERSHKDIGYSANGEYV